MDNNLGGTTDARLRCRTKGFRGSDLLKVKMRPYCAMWCGCNQYIEFMKSARHLLLVR
ncbi:MAG: hypothetical protein II852_11680 [Bacteroidales bacterium]|nr:hypothetical protein [Bacteroidales bacterium]